MAVEIKGLDEALAALEDMTNRVAKQHVRKALAAAADVMVESAKGYAPVLSEPSSQRQPGELRDAINKFPYHKDDKIGYRVGPGYDKSKGEQSPGVYGMFEEFSIGHSAGKGKPYLRPAFDATAEKSVDVFAAKLREEAGL